jgi:hypothetical protein
MKSKPFLPTRARRGKSGKHSGDKNFDDARDVRKSTLKEMSKQI